jgi:apolipoprotein N-acyltransferase
MERLAGKVILLWGWRRALTAFAAGALAVLSQAPFDFFAVCLVSFPVLVWLIDGAVSERRAGWFRSLIPAFAVGWWFGFGYFLAGLWWIGNALLVEADSFAWALPLAILVLPAGLALFYGLAAALARLLWSDGIGRIAALAFAFGAAEWLRAVVLTGFPWNAIGYAAMPTPVLMQSISVTGLFGMNALAVFVFAMPALLASRRHAVAGAVLAVLLVAAHVGFGLLRPSPTSETSGSVALRIVQPSIDQSEKWDTSVRDRIFKTYLDMTAAAPKDGAPRPSIIVWPETAVPFLFTDRPDALAALGEVLQDGQTLLAGAVRSEGNPNAAGEGRYYNSIVVINDKGEIADAFDKVHLVPFGEYLPFEELLTRLGLKKIVQTPVSFSSGAARKLLTVADGVRALPLICYEAIFPDEVAGAAAGADFILNVTNDAWFGDTPGPYQHFRQAQLRAVEFGIPLARAANNGVSAVVGADGRIVDGFALDAVGNLDVAMDIRRSAPVLGTPNVNGIGIMSFFAIFACAMLLARRWRAN